MRIAKGKASAGISRYKLKDMQLSRLDGVALRAIPYVMALNVARELMTQAGVAHGEAWRAG